MSINPGIGAIIETGGKMIAGLTDNTTDDKAIAVFSGLRAVWAVLEAGVEGRLSVEDCDAALTKLGRELAGNDAEADAKLRERFGLGHEVADPTDKL